MQYNSDNTPGIILGFVLLAVIAASFPLFLDWLDQPEVVSSESPVHWVTILITAGVTLPWFATWWRLQKFFGIFIGVPALVLLGGFGYISYLEDQLLSVADAASVQSLEFHLVSAAAGMMLAAALTGLIWCISRLWRRYR